MIQVLTAIQHQRRTARTREQTSSIGDQGVQRGDCVHQGCRERERDAGENANSVVEGQHGRCVWYTTGTKNSAHVRTVGDRDVVFLSRSRFSRGRRRRIERCRETYNANQVSREAVCLHARRRQTEWVPARKSGDLNPVQVRAALTR